MPQGGCEIIIVNMVDSDHGMRDTVDHVSSPWEAESVDERGVVPTTWNLGSNSRGERHSPHISKLSCESW